MNKKAKLNLTSYDNVESLQNFSSLEQLSQYRLQKLSSTEELAGLVKKLFKENRIKVFELGSGNSKLLYRLALDGALEHGIGLEISETRFEFAEKWKKDLNLQNVQNINKNIFEFDLGCAEFDCCIAVDIVLQFLDPIKRGGVKKLLKAFYESLKPGGCVILELYSMFSVMRNIYANNGLFRTWQMFDSRDPFEIILESISLDDDNFVVWEKMFYHRDDRNRNSKMTNILKPYSPVEIRSMLTQAGFTHIDVYKNFKLNEYDYNCDEYVVLARRD